MQGRGYELTLSTLGMCNCPTCSARAGHGHDFHCLYSDSGLHYYKGGHFRGNRRLRMAWSRSGRNFLYFEKCKEF